MLIGQRLGPFSVESELGSGAMGTVYKAVYREEGKPAREVALKIISFGLLGNDSAIARFKRESEILKQLRHPNIVSLFATGRHKQTPFIAMEFVDGKSLDGLLTARGRFGWEDVVAWGKQLCDALQHAHDKGIIHRDLKPSNLMLARDGTLKLTDFGIAKDTDVTALTGANSTIGTAAYMSPEQCRGDRNLTPKSDLYSLGIVLYELTTGRKPFTAETTVEMFLKHVNETPVRPCKTVPDLPVWLDNLIMFLMEKGKDQRPADAATVGRMLADIEQKVGALQSVGAEVANAKRKDRPVGGPLDAADVAAAKSLRAGKKKKKKKPAEPLYRRPWVKGVALAAGLLAVIGTLAVLVLGGSPRQAIVTEPLAVQAEKVRSAGSQELRMERAEKFLWANGATNAPEVEAVRALFRAAKVQATEAGLQRRHAGNLFKSSSEGFEPNGFPIAMKAIDAEKDGDLGRAAKLWEEVRAAAPPADPSKLPDPDEVKKEALGWVAEKRVADIRKEVPARLAEVQKQVETERIFENPKSYQSAVPESAAARAVRLEQFPDRPKARRAWEQLAADTEKDTDRRVWFLLASQQAAQIGGEKGNEEGVRAEREEKVVERVAKLEEAAKTLPADDTAKAARRNLRNGCRDVAALYDDDASPAIQSAVARAKKLIEAVPK